jgi:pSer/pThr/pTyr-binding forkhead associated (FHA) protein
VGEKNTSEKSNKMPQLIHKRPDNTEKSIALSEKPLVIGRLPESDIQVRDSFISRVHCGISWTNNQFTLKDLGSTNGTYRNGARVFECPLASGDKIQVGNTTLLFEIEAADGNGVLRQVSQMTGVSRPIGAPVGAPRPAPGLSLRSVPPPAAGSAAS